MITGGLGFIGSNLARQLVDLGARVLLIDSLIPDYGGNLFNIDGIEDRVKVNIADIRQQSTMNYLVRDQDVIFNLAGQVSHIDSMQDPYTDLEINCRAQLSLLEACRHNNPARQGRVRRHATGLRPRRFLPVTEVASGPANRRQRHQQGGRRVLPPGLQQRLRRPRLLAAPDQRVRAAAADQTQPPGLHRLVHPTGVEDREIQIYGDGGQLRDFVFVDDAADAFLRAGATDACNGQVFNVGGAEPISLRDLVELLIDVAGTGRYRLVEWPPEKKAIDIGDFHADSSLIRRTLGWAADHDRCATVLHERSSSTARTSTHYVTTGVARSPCRERTRLHPFHRSPARRRRRQRSAPQSRASSTRGWFVLGPEVEAFETEFAAACGAPLCRRRRQRHRRDRAGAARARHRPGRRSDRAGDDGGVHRSRGHRRRRHARHRRRRARHADHGPRRVRRRGDDADRAIVPVHLYGQPADMDAHPQRRRPPLAGDRRRLLSGPPGDRRRGRRSARVGMPARSASTRRRISARLATVAPSSPAMRPSRRGFAGCATAVSAIAYDHVEAGVNSRLDELQAAVLRARLPLLADGPPGAAHWPARYRTQLRSSVRTIRERDPGHVYHLFPVRATERDALQAHLARPASRR